MSNATKFEEITNSLISRRAFLKKSFSIGSLALMSTTLGSIPAYSSQSFFNFTKVNCNNNDRIKDRVNNPKDLGIPWPDQFSEVNKMLKQTKKSGLEDVISQKLMGI